MRETSKSFHSWFHPVTSAVSLSDKFAQFAKQYRPYLAAGTVIAISGSAGILGAVQLSTHWSELTQDPLSAHSVGNVVAHSATSNSTPASLDSAHTDATTPTQTASGVTANTTVESHTNTSSQTTGGGNVTVTVNGQTVSVPANGSMSKHVSDGNSDTSVQVSNGATTDNVHSTVNVQVNSTSSGGGTQ